MSYTSSKKDNMIRKVLKKKPSDKLHTLLKKYKIKTEYFTINRRLVSNGVLIGVFFALLPLPSQIMFVLFTTLFIRFNIIIALSIVLLTNPITMPFVIFIEYHLGNWLLHSNLKVKIELSMQWIEHNYSSILLPLLVGSFSAAVVLSLSSYLIVRILWIQSAKKAYKSRKRDL